jgi:hypothetical protein
MSGNRTSTLATCWAPPRGSASEADRNPLRTRPGDQRRPYTLMNLAKLRFLVFVWGAFAVALAQQAPAPAPTPLPASKPPAMTPGWRFEEIRRIPAPEAGQGVVADADHVYAINNHTIAKYVQAGGPRKALWEGGADGPIIHLNAGIVRDGKLYCAHSNFPGVPMLSSVEIFDPATMKHIGSHSFGRTDGSLTWLDRREGKWVACFVHYGRRGGEPNRGPEWTRIVEFDDDWRPTGGWAFPPELMARLAERGYSASGGAFGPGGYLYVMGHDFPELYVLEFPKSGSVLKWIATVAVPAEGQSFGWDPRQPDVLHLASRPRKEIVSGRLHRP